MKKLFSAPCIYSGYAFPNASLKACHAHIEWNLHLQTQDAVFLWLHCYVMQIFSLSCASFMHISTKFKLTYLVSSETLGSPVEFEIIMGLYKFVNTDPLVHPASLRSQNPTLKKRSWQNKLLELMNVPKLESVCVEHDSIQQIKRCFKWTATSYTIRQTMSQVL